MEAGLILMLLAGESLLRSTPDLIRNTDFFLQTYPQSYVIPMVVWLFLHKTSERMKTTTTTQKTTTSPETTTIPNCLTCESINIAECNFFGCDTGPDKCSSPEANTPIVCGQINSPFQCSLLGCTVNMDNSCGPANKELRCVDIITDITPVACDFSIDDSCCVLNETTGMCEEAT